MTLVSRASVGSLLNTLQEVDLYVMDVTAERLLINALLASVNCHLTGYVLPALPVLTVYGLSTGARKPLKL